MCTPESQEKNGKLFNIKMGNYSISKEIRGTSLAVQWLRLYIPRQGCGFSPWWGN